MKKEKVLGVIPARLGSTRLKRKTLLKIAGKPLIYYTWKQATKARLLDDVVIATDAKEIVDVCRGFGAKVMLTPVSIKTGSDRTAAVAKLYKEFTPDVVLNIQGDEPLMPPKAIDTVAKLLLEDKSAIMSTVATALTLPKEFKDPGIVKVVLDKHKNALYFSRSILPYPRTDYKKFLKHIGLYGFRKDFLLDTYVKLKQTELEKAELLEQLRVLENGYKIKVGVGVFNRHEVNTRAEFNIVKKIIEEKLKK